MRAHSLLFAVSMAIAVACAGQTPSPKTSTRAPRAHGESNVLREDYAGSGACTPCHAVIADAWSKTPMHAMTRNASNAVIKAPFSGTLVRFKSDTVGLSQVSNVRFMSVQSKDQGDHVYRVTRVIGGHYREDFAGIEVARAAPDSPVVGDPHDEFVLPVSYLIFSKAFRFKGYSVMSHERPGLRAGPVWNRTCIFCHNTQPYFSTLLGTLPGAHGSVYQGTTVDPLLPEAKRWRTTVTNQPLLDQALEAEISHFGGATPGSEAQLPTHAVSATRAGFDGDELVEVGIGCEACHLGSKSHATDPSHKTSLVPRSDFLTIDGVPHDEGARAAGINHACARCHQVLFTHYPYTWEGGDRATSPGGSHINSGEARDFMLGACSTRLDCTKCHDPHAPDNRARADALEGRVGDSVCTGCHTKFATDDALRAHSHHDPAREGGRCMGCHMPKKNMSLDVRLTRYHRIGSPTDREKQKDRPLECALCHADKSVRTILDTMEAWWNVRFDRTLPTLLYGSLDANALSATLERGKPHEQAVALYLLGEAKSRTDVDAMAHQLTNLYPLVRYYADAALVKTLGNPSPIDLNATDEEITKKAADWLAAASSREAPRGQHSKESTH